MSLGENIVALRKKRGLTQEKLAEVFEVSRPPRQGTCKLQLKN